MSINQNEQKALFLDRDGVLNKLITNRPPWNIGEVHIFKEAYQIINLASKNYFLPIIITNQPDAGRGKLKFNEIDNINNYISAKLGIQNSYICKHPYDGMCECRKPKPGMLFRARDDHKINLKKSFLIGDRDKDILAGSSAGCKTIHLSKKPFAQSDYSVENHFDLIRLLENLLK